MAIGAFIIIGFLTKTDDVNELKKTDASGGNDYMYDRIVAITFDDGPCSRTTNRLLDGLKERNVKATFFLVGENAESNEKVVKRMYEEGHLIGNHTYSHIKLDECNVSSAVGEINKTNEIIKSITGEDVKYIRPPYGAYSDKLLSHVNMTPVLWSIDPDDWATTDTAYVVKSVVYKVKNGDIILLHDIYDSSVEAALEIIDRLSSKGFVFVTVDQLMLD
ncbi:polysaccharide deacetylase family protein [Lachnospira sp. NSJ-43]|uniref:Polysaccharide deacetylase family protein n=2 Tax=Lachnospira hominis (ex Liu et al. 2021) TaxID=2763051 RepID=A0ABR7FXR8_9FIRM|nr:polysaccharide deacetylase family protein [Lachnospira hominis]